MFDNIEYMVEGERRRAMLNGDYYTLEPFARILHLLDEVYPTEVGTCCMSYRSSCLTIRLIPRRNPSKSMIVRCRPESRRDRIDLVVVSEGGQYEYLADTTCAEVRKRISE